jgi:penicillin-binding protein 2
VGKTAILGDAPGYTLTPDPMHQLDMNPAVMNIVREGLCNVTTARSGTAEFIFRDSELQTIGVCGKTGTAQDVPRPTHAWFAAYAPREEPEVAIVVVVENGGQGSEVAAPIVRDILEHYFFESQRG